VGYRLNGKTDENNEKQNVSGFIEKRVRRIQNIFAGKQLFMFRLKRKRDFKRTQIDIPHTFFYTTVSGNKYSE
jgi:hypothetical protein